MEAFKMTRRTMLGSAAAFALAGSATAATPAVHLQPGTPALSLGPFDAAGSHYVVEEYIVSGTAASYKEQGAPDAQGNWNVVPADTAPYVTRIVVVRPADARKYNGSVVVEWLNESGGFDFGPVWNIARRELVRSGSAYVAVSAQKIGIEGGKTVFGLPADGLKKQDPKRYGSLSHPGDAYSYDIFSQVAALLKSKGAGGVFGDLVPGHVIGAGESQSAVFLTTYVNAVDPVARAYDGFLIYSRFGGAAPLDGSGMFGKGPFQPVKMGSDLRVPTMIFETETDLLGPHGYYLARQPDTERLRVWEIAGTSHADAYLFKVSAVDSGKASAAALAEAYAPDNNMRGTKLDKAYNNGPQNHYVLEAAVAHLERWVAGGQAPPHAKPFDLVPTDLPNLPARPVLDANGNIMGGVRTPWVDVPISTLAGYGNSGSPAAMLVGSVVPFDAAKLAKLYPGGRDEYMRLFEASLNTTIQAGFILAADREEILALARLGYPSGASGSQNK